MNKTIRDVIIFNAAAAAYIKEFDPGARPRTKLGYACRRVTPQTDRLLSDYNERLEDLRVVHCLTEKDKEGKRGKILYSEAGKYQFDAEGLAAFTQASRALLAGEAQFEPHFATEVPDDIPAELFDAMVGFTISEEVAETILSEPAAAVTAPPVSASTPARPEAPRPTD